MSERTCQCDEAHGACAIEFQYAVKLVCGEVVTQENLPTPVAPGRYWTATNIHNPTKCRDAHFRWKVAVANPGRPGPISPYSRLLSLKPDEAIEIDCQQVMKAFPPPPPKFVKGFVVIESDIALDVVAVYSGTTGPCGSNFFHTERVQPRSVAVCEDLMLPLNTGFAAWQTISPTSGPAVLVSPVASGWGSPPAGASWISEKSSDGGNGPTHSRSYQLCFDVCSGFTVPAPFQIQASSDGPANIFLNGSSIGTIPGWATPTTLTVNPSFLRAGGNCFRVDVPNGGEKPNPTGFALAGLLHVLKGKCPCSALPIGEKPTHGPGLEGTFESEVPQF